MEKSSGPKTEPWGTEALIGMASEAWPARTRDLTVWQIVTQPSKGFSTHSLRFQFRYDAVVPHFVKYPFNIKGWIRIVCDKQDSPWTDSFEVAKLPQISLLY